jgi:hypothetical protein
VIPELANVLTAAAEVLEQDSMRTTTQAANADGLGLRYIAFNHGFLLGKKVLVTGSSVSIRFHPCFETDFLNSERAHPHLDVLVLFHVFGHGIRTDSLFQLLAVERGAEGL